MTGGRRVPQRSIRTCGPQARRGRPSRHESGAGVRRTRNGASCGGLRGRRRRPRARAAESRPAFAPVPRTACLPAGSRPLAASLHRRRGQRSAHRRRMPGARRRWLRRPRTALDARATRRDAPAPGRRGRTGRHCRRPRGVADARHRQSLRYGHQGHEPGRVLDPFVFHPKLLAAVRHVLGPRFRYSSSNFHCPLPGYGHQAIHADWGWGVRDPEVVNAIWLLDDFTAENGPTRVVPGIPPLARTPCGIDSRRRPQGSCRARARRSPADRDRG